MKKILCDLCSAEISSQLELDYCSRGKEHTLGLYLNYKIYEFKIRIEIASIHENINGGQIQKEMDVCKYCLLDMIDEMDDRLKEECREGK